MGVKSILRRVAAGAPPLEREDMDEQLVEIGTVRSCIANVLQAREAHAAAVGVKDGAVLELNELTEQRAALQTRLTAREKEIALAGGELPDEPFPEEGEIARLNRHIRIRQESVRNCEGKVAERQEQTRARIEELESSWSALGTVIGERLLKNFREGAVALRDAQLGYIALGPHFFKGWSSAAWRRADAKLAIADPANGELILNPLLAKVAAKWPDSAQALAKNMGDLRAEIDAVKSA